jgi:hypothetical protein
VRPACASTGLAVLLHAGRFLGSVDDAFEAAGFAIVGFAVLGLPFAVVFALALALRLVFTLPPLHSWSYFSL